MSRPRSWLLGVVIPLLIIVLILGADALEGPKTAYVGVLAVVPMFAAVFGTPLSTAVVGAVTWVAAFTFGHLATDGNVTAQTVRLIIIGIVVVIAVLAAALRTRQEHRLGSAERAAAEAAQFQRLAETDLLTQIPNRLGILHRIESEGGRSDRTIALLDLDNLKVVNDTHGHAVGDEYIAAIAGRLAGAVSRRDLVGRWGGDEFIIVIDLPVDDARPVLDRLHQAVTDRQIQVGATVIPAAASLGASPWAAGESIDEALSRADASLYEAKQTGRNRVVLVA